MTDEVKAILEELVTNYGGDDVAGITAIIDKLKPALEPVVDDRYDKLKADYIARYFGRVVGGDPIVPVDDSVSEEESSMESEAEDKEEKEEMPESVEFERKEEVED